MSACNLRSNSQAVCNAVRSYIVFSMGERENAITVKVKVTLEQATKAQRGSRGVPLLFL